jgi:hypothetical protein
MAPGFRRDDVWTPVFGELSRAVSTGVTTFYDSIKIEAENILQFAFFTFHFALP